MISSINTFVRVLQSGIVMRATCYVNIYCLYGYIYNILHYIRRFYSYQNYSQNFWEMDGLGLGTWISIFYYKLVLVINYKNEWQNHINQGLIHLVINITNTVIRLYWILVL